MVESPRAPAAPSVHFTIWLVVPAPERFDDVVAPSLVRSDLRTFSSFDSAARTKADRGLPPNVSASAAFRAYGTLTSRIRGCVTSVAAFDSTPNQRASL